MTDPVLRVYLPNGKIKKLASREKIRTALKVGLIPPNAEVEFGGSRRGHGHHHE
jgi:hypothetical protein